MLLAFIKSKLFILFSVILFEAFIIGYDYAVITSMEPSAASSGTAAVMPAQVPKLSDRSPELDIGADDPVDKSVQD
jgi:hypothetical protein